MMGTYKIEATEEEDRGGYKGYEGKNLLTPLQEVKVSHGEILEEPGDSSG